MTARFELRPQMLDDIQQVEAKLLEMLQEGRGHEVITLMLGLLVDLRDRHLSAESRLHGLLRKVYGRSSEKVAQCQLDLFLATLDAKKSGGTPPQDKGAEPAPSKPNEPQLPKPELKPAPSRKGKKRPFPEGLPIEIVPVRVPDAERPCPSCGKDRINCGHETSQIIEYVPPQFKIIEEQREKLVCRSCSEISTAPLGPRVVEGGRPGPQLVATLIVDKWQDATPHNRNTDIFGRLGVHFSRSTLTDWAAEGLEALAPIAWRITQQTLAETYINIDDTGLRVLDRDHPSGVKRGHLWAIVASEAKLVTYFYTKDWTTEGPAARLANFEGFLQGDEYAGYEAIAEAADGRIIRLGCHMHSRRKFEAALQASDARAAIAMNLYKKIYAVERSCKEEGLAPETRRERRLRETAPLLEELKTWVDEIHGGLRPSELLYKATYYAREHWDLLTRFLDDGRLEIDNGIVERELRRVAIGRRNWLFAGSDVGAERAAVAYTILATCRMQGVEPYSYLVDVLRKLSSGWPMSRIDELLPQTWARLRAPPEQT
jgi:transposase